MFNNIYKNRKVLITGHSGFKGSWLSLWLKKLGADVLGYSLEPNTNPSMFEELRIYGQVKNEFNNILNSKKLEEVFLDFKPEVVFHLASQPLVRLSYKEPKNTYETNVIGTLNVLEASRKTSSIKALINVTTDKCYENLEQKDKFYSEDDKMGGYDIYSSSKACSEILSSSYRRSFLNDDDSFLLATARAGNVIGGGDWAKDRLVPDCVTNINKDEPIQIRNKYAIRPWQFVLEPLYGYLLLGQKLLEGQNKTKYASAFNFGPEKNDVLRVIDVASLIAQNYKKGEIIANQEKSQPHEAKILLLDNSKAKKELGWKTIYNPYQAIEKTVLWYKKFYNEENMLDFTLKQIEEFEQNLG